MEEIQRENSIIQGDDYEDIESETVDSDMEADHLETQVSYSKISVKVLTRKPLHYRGRPLQKNAEKKPVNLNEINKNPKTEKEVTSYPELLMSYLLPVLCLLLLVLGTFLYMHWTNASPSLNKQLNIQALMTDLRSQFGGQPLLTYRVIETAIKKASSENSNSPGIIVLISSRENERTTNKLADSLVELVSKPLHSVLIDTGSSLTANRLKKEIDVTIKGNLTEKQLRAVLVRNLDQIPFEAALIFHSYCDHENAPFKRAVYVMTAFVNESISPSSGTKQWDVLASERLKSAWSSSDKDQVASLISRLTVSVAAVVSKG